MNIAVATAFLASRPRALAAGLLSGLMLVMAGSAGAATVTDATGRTIDAGKAQRIVAVGGSVTEILAALGADDRIIAIDSTSSYPARVKGKPNVGYMRALNPEGVLALGPDLVLAIEGSGPTDALEVLKRSSVPVVIVPEAHDAAGIGKKIAFVAEVVGETAKGEALAKSVAEDFAALDATLDKLPARRKAVFVLAVGGGAPTAAGEGTAADAMFALAHVDNALAGFRGYKTVVDESAVAAAPEAVVMMNDRGHATPAVLELPAFRGTPAARDGRIVGMGGLYLLGFGPRSAHAASDLARTIYADQNLPALPPRAWTQDAQ